ncbi:MAG: DNA adenine methylase [Bacteroidales bacterium]|nr:DNA adenine methylase [Bacteroidales bacterium]
MNRTPLRYPGGKQKLTPFVQEILECNQINGHYAEPYAGGAGVALELLLNKKVKFVHLNDSDIRIYAFWHAVKNENELLCKKIASASLTIEEWKFRREVLKEPLNYDLFEVGFSTFYMNRCNRSGVLKAGIIGGLNQDGNYKMDARFSINDLIRRIELIGLYGDNIIISNLDAEYYIENYIPNIDNNCLIYFDPPYFNKAKDLYLNSYLPDDHKRLAMSIQENVKKHWILSYDNVPEITSIYKNRRNFKYNLQYSAARSYKGREIFIFCDNLKLPKSCGLKFIDSELKELIEK